MNKLTITAIIISLLCSCSKSERHETAKEVGISFVFEGETKSYYETRISDLSIFQFNNSTGTLIKKEYISSYNEYLKVKFLTPPDGILDVYFTANVGDQTVRFTEGHTNRREVDTATFSVSKSGYYTYIPMAGMISKNTSVDNITVPMERAVAKVTIIAKSAIKSDSLELTIGEITLRGIPSRGRLFSSNEMLPDDNVSYFDVIKKNFSSGDTIVWYIPENIQGINPAITDYEGKNIHTMPSENCSRATIAAGYRHFHLFDYGETDIIIGGTNCTEFNVIRNTHYLYNITISDINDSRINWLSRNNTIPYIENGVNHGNGIFYYKGIWAPVNYGTDNEHPFGVYNFYDEIHMQNFTAAKNPCPLGWRIPSLSEYEFITSSNYTVRAKYYYEWDNGLKYISNYLARDTLYFPANGYYIKNFDLHFSPSEGFYLCSYRPNPVKRIMTFSSSQSAVLRDLQMNMYTNIRCILDSREYQRSFYPLNN